MSGWPGGGGGGGGGDLTATYLVGSGPPGDLPNAILLSNAIRYGTAAARRLRAV